MSVTFKQLADELEQKEKPLNALIKEYFKRGGKIKQIKAVKYAQSIVYPCGHGRFLNL